MSSNTTKPTVSLNKASKDAGFDNFRAFLLSYNLRLENPDDIEEGKAILRGMGYNIA
ncbi:hypothetical protein K504DRAFT_467692 [Pleomassaria siparia CBS 279.74]|uniref:Uncharacterized protein n=1 Tax=Pleomassaria siparia CBS 279.74 TaxID=1314801 RepID=A0A6G1KB29_9PLEO|nr:hypothetical protein K504DRAFT_467692 [Pleomassaria siparia CBS 279.74]